MDRSVGVSTGAVAEGRRSGLEGESSGDRLLWGTAVRFRAAVVGKEKSKVRGGCFFG